MALGAPAGAGAARAQDNQNGQNGDQNFGIEEIVVTARKREENLQETPISITAFTAASLAERSFNDLSDIGSFTPNMDFSFAANGSGGGNNATIYIRGVGQNDFLLTTDPGVGIYIDGVYFARSMGGVMDLLDLERVEVLRGPQGTLFGKNTIGGAINIISAKPSGEFAGHGDVTLGSRNRLDARFSVDVPLVKDKLAAKISASSRDQDGYGHRLIDGIDLGDVNQQAARAVLLWTPSDTLEVTTIADYSRGREQSAAQTLTAVVPDNAPILNLWNALVGGPSGQPITAALIQDNPFNTLQTGRSVNDMDVWGVNMTVDWDTDPLHVKSITAYRDSSVDFARDGDNSPAPYVETFNQTTSQQFSQELQLSGRSFSDRLNWLLGGYLFHEKATDITDVTLADGLFNALEALPGPVVPLFNPAAPGPFQGLSCPPPPGVFAPCAGGMGNPINIGLDLDFDINNLIKINSYALFGQGTFDITEKLSVTAGLRYTYEKKNYTIVHIRKNAGTFVIPPTTVGDSWQSFSPRFGIDYKASKDVMVYVSAARGFKSGGFNGRPTVQSALQSYDPEYIWSYEAGVKSDLLERRLQVNIATFYNDYSNIQLSSVQATESGNLLLVVENAGKARVKGFEVEAKARPVRWLDLSGGLGYTDAKFTKLKPGATVTRASRFQHTPKWNANLSAQVTAPAGNAGTITLRGDYTYTSKLFNDSNNTPQIAQNGYSLINARLAFTSASEAWEIALFGTNLGDKTYFVSGIAALDSFGTAEAVLGRPREWGITGSFRF